MNDDSDDEMEGLTDSPDSGSNRLPAEKADEDGRYTGKLGRRDYLRLSTAAAAVATGAAAMQGVSAATSRKGVSFDRVVDAVEDLGLDPTGGEPVDDTLESALASGALVEFPEGDYRVTREISVGSTSGIRGLGGDRSGVRFVPDRGLSSVWLRFNNPHGFLIENVTLDRREDYDTSIGMMGNVEHNLQIHEVEYAGWTPSGPQMLLCNVTDSDGQLVVDGFYRLGPTEFRAYPESSLDIYLGTISEATHTLRNLEIHNGSESAIYAGKAPGPVTVEDSYFKNCVHTAVRVAGENSAVKRTTVVMDAGDWDPRNEVVESTYDGDARIELNRGIWTQTNTHEKAGPLVEDCDVIIREAPAAIAGIFNQGDCGGIRLRNSRVQCDADGVIPIYIDEEWNHDVMNPPYYAQLQNVSVTGSGSDSPAVLVEGRDGTTIQDCCIYMPNTNGIVFDGTQSGVVEDCDISTGGEATVFNDAKVDVSNVGSTDSCPLPSMGTRPSQGSTLTDDGSGSDDSSDGESTGDGSTSGGSDPSMTGTLEIVSVEDGPLFHYEMTVDGGIERLQAGTDNDAESSDGIVDNGDGTYTVTGRCGNGYGDGFKLTDASVTTFETDTTSDSFFILLDGTRLTVDELLDGASETTDGSTSDGDTSDDGTNGDDTTDSTGTSRLEIVSVEDGPLFRYRFTTSGTVARVQEGSDNDAESSDGIVDNGDGTYTVTGRCGNGYGDAFDITGISVTEFTTDTTADAFFLRLDGSRVTVDELVEEDGSTNDTTDGGSGSDGTTAGDNFVFTNRTELQAIADRANSGQEPWASAWAKVQESADNALGVSLQSVTDDNGSHTYDTDNNDRHDYRESGRTGDRVRNLALSHFVTGDDRYAEKAIDQIHHWFLNPDTYQAPQGSGQFGVEQYITIPKFLMGAAILRGHPYWANKSAATPWNGGSAASAEDALAEWAVTWANNLEEPYYNNIWIWLAVAEGSAAAYARDDSLFQAAVGRYKDTPAWNDYNSDGGFQAELNRDNGFRYQLFRMKAHAMFCELARHRGTDLYEHNDLKRSFDWMAQYVQNPDQWEWGTGTLDFDLSLEAPGLYELAHSIWQEPAYLNIIQQAGRPVSDGRLLQWTTFSHGELFALEGDSGGDTTLLPNTIRVDGVGSPSSYTFEVSDDARKVDADTNDTVSDTTISGSVTDEEDVYEFAGTVTSMVVDGNVNISFGSSS